MKKYGFGKFMDDIVEKEVKHKNKVEKQVQNSKKVVVENPKRKLMRLYRAHPHSRIWRNKK